MDNRIKPPQLGSQPGSTPRSPSPTRERLDKKVTSPSTAGKEDTLKKGTNLSTTAQTSPAEPSLPRPNPRAEKKARKEKEAKQAAKEQRRANRLPHIPNPGSVRINNDKFDNFALNSAHPYGRSRSVTFAKAGFQSVAEYDKEDLEVGRKAARANPEYLAGREIFKTQLTQNLATTPADPRPGDANRNRYDTRHNIINTSVDKAEPVVVKAQWLYQKTEESVSNNAHLGSVQPSQWSSDEEE